MFDLGFSEDVAVILGPVVDKRKEANTSLQVFLFRSVQAESKGAIWHFISSFLVSTVRLVVSIHVSPRPLRW